MTDKVTCEIWMAMNEDGGWAVSTDESEALQKLGEDEGGFAARVIKLSVKMTPPAIADHEVNVPDEAGATKQIETEVF
jgi:hypothetical protein